MPIVSLPSNTNLEQLKKHAKTLQQFVRAGVPEALEMVREFHPRLDAIAAGTLAATAFSRADAQAVIARRHGFTSWPKLRAQVEMVQRYTRSPHREPAPAAGAGAGAETTATGSDTFDRFLRLACLTHGDDDPARWRRAGELIAAHPDLATLSIHVAAALGDVATTSHHLEQDPSAARREGGPHRWEPLLYLVYSAIDDRAPGRSQVEVARLLLDAGADPNAGYLWEGLIPPYTALTGAFGTREAPHAQSLELARLLLERGADPNDGQALYELWDDDEHAEALELLFAFGLGAGTGGVWRQRLGPAYPTPVQLVEDELRKAAAGNWPHRMGAVLDHGVDVNGRGTDHPIFEGLSAYELAVVNGNVEVVILLTGAGAAPDPPDPVLEFLGAGMRGDHAAVTDLRNAHPGIVAKAVARRPHQVSVAASKDRPDSVELMVQLGFDVNAADRYPHKQTALHGAAFNGNLDLVRYLIEQGADPTVEDCSFHATPLGWADHNGQKHVVEYLATLQTENRTA